MVLSILYFFAVLPKFGVFWLFKSAIAAEIALLLTMVEHFKEMCAHMCGAAARWSNPVSGRMVGLSLKGRISYLDSTDSTALVAAP